MLLVAFVIGTIGVSTVLHQGVSVPGVGLVKSSGSAHAADATELATAEPASPAALALPNPLPTRTLRVPILMYHRVATLWGDEPAITVNLTVEPQEYGLQMQWLKDQGYTTVTQLQLFNALMHGAELPAKPIMITFDDGYRGIVTNAAPVMQRLGMTGTAYVVTDRIAENPKTAPTWMTWPQLKLLERRGWDIGSHTVSHRELPSLSHDEALKQLRQSRFALEHHLRHPVQWFCYPAGRLDASSVELVREAGYVLATTTQSGVEHSASDPLRLTRVRISNSTGVRGLAAALST